MIFAHFLMLFISFASANIYVGNPAEGYTSENQVYLRDLLDMDRHLNAHVGSQVDPRIWEKLETSPVKKIGPPMEKLARKLTDLQRLSPELGIYVAEAINYYQWVLVSQTLELPPFDGSPLALGSKLRVALANRFQNTIRVQKQLWPQLNDENKIALIVHEALFSLLEPDCIRGNSLCFQQSFKVRDIVALAFADPGQSAYRLTQQMEGYLAIPKASARLACGHGVSAIDFKIAGKDFKLEKAASATRRKEFIESFCAKNIERIKRREPLSLSAVREPYQIHELVYYTTSQGTTYSQVFLKIVDVPSRLDLLKDKKFLSWNLNSCVGYISEMSDIWFDYRPGFLNRDPIDFCRAL